jgi:osmotically-inducible protein OsmY
MATSRHTSRVVVVKHALERNAAVNADRLDVATSDGTVTIHGTVRSWAEHDAALDAAWAAPGVKTVHDEMTVLSGRP